MSKMMLWIAFAVGGGIGSVIPMLFGSQDLMWPIILSTVGSIAGIWFWYKFLRFY